MRRMAHAGIDISLYLPEAFDVVHPLVQERFTAFYKYYDNPLESRMPFEPKIDRQDLLRLDGQDEVAASVMSAG